MKLPPLWMATGIILILTVAGCAPKRQNGGPSPERMEKMRAEIQKTINARDTNQDGLLTCEDIALNRATLFTVADADESLSLEAEEYFNLHWHDTDYIFLELRNDDLNGDGVVTLEEFQQRPDSFFFATDKNQDCILSPEELRAGMRGIVAEKRSGPKAGKRPGGGKRRRVDVE